MESVRDIVRKIHENSKRKDEEWQQVYLPCISFKIDHQAMCNPNNHLPYYTETHPLTTPSGISERYCKEDTWKFKKEGRRMAASREIPRPCVIQIIIFPTIPKHTLWQHLFKWKYCITQMFHQPFIHKSNLVIKRILTLKKLGEGHSRAIKKWW